MGFKDFLGRIVRPAELKQEIAAPSATGSRPVRPDSVWAGMTPSRLASVLRAAAGGDTAQYYALAEELEERDAHYCAVLNTRKRQVVQLDVTVQPADETPAAAEHAALIEQWIGRDDLIEELFDLQDAVGKGTAILEIDWDVGAQPLLPKRLIWRDPRHFGWDKETLSRPLLKVEGGQTAELPAWKFIVHRHQAKSGVPARDGLARQCAFLSLFKSLTVKGWVAFCETYGQPYRLGKYRPGASEADRETLLDAVLAIAADAGAIIPESMQIEFVKTDVSGSAQAFEALARYANQEISKLVLGQTTTTEAISGGHAVSREHNDVREDIERSDARALAATLKRDLIIPIITLNFGAQAAYPSLRIGRPEALDVKDLMEAVAKLVPLGFQVPQAYLRERLYVPEAEDGEPLLQGQPAPPPVVNEQLAQPATAAYSPTQPRAPAGGPKAGQWVSKKGAAFAGVALEGAAKEIDKAADRLFAHPKLDAAVAGAVRWYKGEEGYVRINSAVRAGKPEAVSEHVARIDAAIAASKTKADMIVFRGMSRRHFGADLQDLVGQTIADPAYTSASLNQRVAKNFGRRGDAVIIEIRVRKGSPALYAEKVQNFFENEVLLPRKAVLKVTAVEGNKMVAEFVGTAN